MGAGLGKSGIFNLFCNYANELQKCCCRFHLDIFIHSKCYQFVGPNYIHKIKSRENIAWLGKKKTNLHRTIESFNVAAFIYLRPKNTKYCLFSI